MILFYFFTNIVFAQQDSWTQWYQITQLNSPLSAYKEETEFRKKRKEWSVVQNWWEKNKNMKPGDAKVYEQIIGTVVNSDFKPQAYHLEKKNGTNWVKISARAKDKNLKIKVEKSQSKVVREFETSVAFDNETTLGALTNIYIMKKWTERKNKTAPIKFKAIQEDGLGSDNFKPVEIMAIPQKKDMKIDGKKCHVFLVKFFDHNTMWFIDETGRLCRMSNSKISSTLR